MNKVILMGRLTRDPETRYTQGAEPTAVVRYTLAVNKQFKREGESDADFINCVAFAKRGEFAQKYFKKGQMVAVCGHLSVYSYDDQNTNTKRWVTDVIIDDQYFAESKSNFESRGQNSPIPPEAYAPVNQGSTQQSAPPDGFFPLNQELEDDDDLPF